MTPTRASVRRLARALSPRPATLDPAARTIEAIVSTGAAVARTGYVERLDLRGGDLSQLVGGPVLDAHRTGSTRDQLGVVEAAELRPEGLWVRLRFRSNDAAAAVLADIGDGTLRGLSVGYAVAEWRESREGGRRVRTAVRWTPAEVSLVPVPADPGAHFRTGAPAAMDPEELDDDTTVDQARETRAAVNREIRAIAATAGLTRAWADARIDENATADQARASAFEAMRARSAETRTRTVRASVGFDNADPAVVTHRMAEAIAADAAGVPVTDAGATQFRGLGFRALARMTVEGGHRLADAAAVDAAFTRGGGGSHSVSDFPAALEGAGARIVMHAYGEAASPLEANLVTYGTAPDFRPVTEVGLGGFPDLQRLPENGEITAVTTAEASTSWSLGTYAARFDVSRQMLVNDDLGLFGRIGAELGRAARRTETAAIVALLVANPVLADGTALFHANHGNLAASGAALAEAPLVAGLQAVQAQRGLGGEVIGLRASWLLVAPAAEIAARKLIAAVSATKAADVNPLSGLVELLVEPRLTGTAWYLFAKPSAAPVLKVGHLAGQAGPVVQSHDRWSGLGTGYRVWTDFGVTVVDHRGAYRNAGA